MISFESEGFVIEHRFAREQPTPGLELEWIAGFIPITILAANGD